MPIPSPASVPFSSRRAVWAFALVFLFVAVPRFVKLTERPMHNDEGVNGFFMMNLVRSGSYKYDPTNYHGPALYYFQLVPTWLANFARGPLKLRFSGDAGLTVFSVRATVAMVSLFVILGLMAAQPFIGTVGALAAALLLGLSCSFLFYSRYFIHEIYVVLFTLTIVLGAAYFGKTRRVAYFYGVALSAVLLFCMKETGVMHMGILALAFGLTSFLTASARTDARLLLPENKKHVLYAVFMVVAIWALLFSSFFKNPHGLIDSFKAYGPWARQGFESGHVKPWTYYLTDLLWSYEPGLLILSVAGLLVAAVLFDRWGLFLSLWTVGTILAYTLIPYKTPWLIVDLLLPMAFLTGYAVNAVWTIVATIEAASRRRRAWMAFGAVSALLLIVPSVQTWKVNYVEWDNERHPQIYAHTSREMFRLVDRIKEMAEKSGLGKDMVINVTSREYWPLPFYWKDFPNAKFWGVVEGVEPLDAPAIVAMSDQHSEVRERVKEYYVMETYQLRPGVYLDLWISNDVADSLEPPQPPLDLSKEAVSTGPLVPGLREQLFSNENGEGTPVVSRMAKQPMDFFIDVDGKKPLSPPFSIQWSGYFKAPMDGQYGFALDSDDGSSLVIDGKTAIDNGGRHAIQRKTRLVRLSKGLHSFKCRYADVGGYAEFRIWWTPPGAPEEKMPARVFFTSH